MARRPQSRWLAPLAIVAVGGAAYGILKSGVDGGTTKGTVTKLPSKRTGGLPSGGSGGTAPTATVRRTYIVRSGDTLSAISLETGVPVARIQQLNPGVDVQALQPGQRLTLRP